MIGSIDFLMIGVYTAQANDPNVLLYCQVKLLCTTQIKHSIVDHFSRLQKTKMCIVSVNKTYNFCCSLPENLLLLRPTSNSLTRKYIHFIESTFVNAFATFN